MSVSSSNYKWCLVLFQPLIEFFLLWHILYGQVIVLFFCFFFQSCTEWFGYFLLLHDTNMIVYRNTVTDAIRLFCAEGQRHWEFG